MAIRVKRAEKSPVSFNKLHDVFVSDLKIQPKKTLMYRLHFK